MTMQAELHDGRVLEFPDGTDPSVIQSTVKKMLAPPEVSGAERLLGTPVGSLALGAADLGLGAAQLGANIGSKLSPYLPGGEGNHSVVADWANEKMAALNAASERGRAAQGRTGFDAWRALGGVGAGTAASLGDKAIVTGLPYATSYLGKVAQGLGLGTFFGGTSADTSTTPQTNDQYLGNQTTKAELGGLAGGGMAAVVAPVVRGGYNLLEPHLPGGTARVAQRTLVDAAGPARDKVQQELLKQQTPFTTAGEAAVPARRAEFAGLQEKLKPYAPSKYLDIKHQANQGLVDEVQRIAQTPADYASAVALRKANADVGYETMRGATTPIDVTPAIDHIDKVLEQNPGNLHLVRELTNIRKGLVDDLHVKGLPAYAAKNGARTDAREIASVIDGMQTTMEHQDNKNILGQLVEVRKKIVDAIPGYPQVEADYARASGPINKMEYGQFLKDKLQSALEDKLTPGAFAQARRNETSTIHGALGATPLTQESQLLAPQEISALDKVTAQLQRNAAYKEQAAAGLPSANRLVRDTLDPDHVPNFFMRSVMIGHHILDRLQGHAETKALTTLAEVMQNPNVTGQLMQSADPAKQAMIKALVERGATVGASLSAPKLIRERQ